MIPRSIKAMPRPRRKRGEFIRLARMVAILPVAELSVAILADRAVLVQPARHGMTGLGLEVGRELHVTQAGHEMRTARMEAATRWRIGQTGWLTGRHFLKGFGVVRIRVGGGGQQGVSVGMQRILQQAARVGFFDQITGVHHEDALRKIFHRGKIVGNVDH